MEEHNKAVMFVASVPSPPSRQEFNFGEQGKPLLLNLLYQRLERLRGILADLDVQA